MIKLQHHYIHRCTHADAQIQIHKNAHLEIYTGKYDMNSYAKIHTFKENIENLLTQ